jgi:hypothetical protein
MPPKLDLLGKRFGKLLVLSEVPKRGQSGKVRWECLCDCWNLTTVFAGDLASGSTRSCGCLIGQNQAHRTHGDSKSTEYGIWNTMKHRCLVPKNINYKHYGARGIKICARWLGERGFQNFLLDMGRRPSMGHSLDRINNDGNYEPGNCRWATRSQQNLNRRIFVPLQEVWDGTW